MTRHVLAADLVALGWDSAIASAAEDALTELAALQAPFDALDDARGGFELPELCSELESTSAASSFSAAGASSYTASAPKFRSAKR